MSDVIYREQAIDAMGCLNDSICEQQAVDALWELPSAEKTGKWIKNYRGHFSCSVCGARYKTTDEYGNIIDGDMNSNNYCSNCGARMVSDNE